MARFSSERELTLERINQQKEMEMKKIVAVIAAVALLSSPTVAMAEGTNKPAKTSEYRAALEKWKSDGKAAMDAYKAAMADYVAKAKANAASRKSANEAFKSAVDAAKSAYQSAVTASSTAEAKTAAVNARKAAIAAATAARDAAIKAIAPLPAKPSKPTLAAKPSRPTA